MLEEPQLAQFKSMVENAQSVIVLLSDHASVDEVSSALAFHLIAREMGKDSRVAAVALPQFDQPKLAAQDQITTELGNQNLTISFDYTEEQVDKVSYHIGEETQKFYLTVKPRSGAAPLDTSSVEFSYTGAAADLIVYVGINSLEELEQLYYGYEDLYDNSQSIGLTKTDSPLGMLHLSPTHESSFAELLTTIFSSLQFPLPAQAASNLVTGIEYATKGLTQGMIGATTFESIANLMRAGGERQAYSRPQAFQRQHTAPQNQQSKNEKTELTINKKANSHKPNNSGNQSKKSKKHKQSSASASQ